MKSFLEKLCERLVMNKDFPYYQAERRIDIFVNLFLEEIYKAKFNETIEFIAPEFPLKKVKVVSNNTIENSFSENINTKRPNDKCNVDYLYYNKLTSKIIFVELKTDNNSFNKTQLIRYIHSNWKDCCGFITKKLGLAGKYKVKFETLQKAIEDKRADNIEILYIIPKGSITKLEKTIRDLALSETEKNRIKYITFEEFENLEISSDYKDAWEIINNNLFKKIIHPDTILTDE
jgi:hypothetical protein